MKLTTAMFSFLEASDICYLATQGDTPNVVPIGFRWLWNDRLLIADLFLGKTRANIEANGQVALAVATSAPKTGFQFKGRATIYTEGEAYDAAVEGLLGLGVEAAPRSAVVVEVTQIYRLGPGAGAGGLIASF